jgi:hypothetical protein
MESQRFKIEVIGHTKIEDHMEYIINVEKNGQNFSFTERYSGLRGLNESLRKSTNKLTFPKFPPKKFFGSEDEKFIVKRQQEINIYFDIICKDPDFISLPPLIKFIEEKSKKQNLKGTPQIKKENIKEEQNELKKSMKGISEKDYEKIVKEFNSKYYIMNSYDNINDNDKGQFIKYFKNNKINFEDDDEVYLNFGNNKNYNYINNSKNDMKNIEENIKNKILKIEEYYQSLVNKYNTDGILVQI